MVDDRGSKGDAGAAEWRWHQGAPGGGRGRAKKKAEEHEKKKEEDEKEREEVEEEYAAARKSRPIFQRGTIATERPGDHLKYLVAGRKLSGTGSR